MRATGVYYRHIPVYTARLILCEVSDMDGVLRVVGTVMGKLCNLPVKVGPIQPTFDGKIGFRPMCASTRHAVMPSVDANDQWFAAILDAGATIHNGGCTLLSPSGGTVLRCRRVVDSLQSEMNRMGCGGGGDLVLAPMPPRTNEENRHMVTLERVVDNLAITYTGVGGDGGMVALENVMRLPSQSIDVHRMMVFGSEAMMHTRDGFRILWARSFQTHTCYHVREGVILEKLY